MVIVVSGTPTMWT